MKHRRSALLLFLIFASELRAEIVDLKYQPPQTLDVVSQNSNIIWSPNLSFDRLELYWTDWNNENQDIWFSSRESVDAPWSDGQRVENINSSAWDDSPTLSPNGLEIYFGSQRPSDNGSGWDLYRSVRDCRACPWSTPVNLGPEINTRQGEGAPSLTGDGLTMYYGGGWGNDGEIRMATRTGIDQPWRPATFPGDPSSSSLQVDNYPAVSTDNLTLHFASARVGGYGSHDIFVSTRHLVTEPFGPAKNLGPVVNGSQYDTMPFVDSAGNLFLTANAVSGVVPWRLHQVSPGFTADLQVALGVENGQLSGQIFATQIDDHTASVPISWSVAPLQVTAEPAGPGLAAEWYSRVIASSQEYFDDLLKRDVPSNRQYVADDISWSGARTGVGYDEPVTDLGAANMTYSCE